MSIFQHTRPGSAPERIALRAVMLGRSTTIGGAPRGVAAALRASLLAAAFGLHPPAEREWIERIAIRRAAVAAQGAGAYRDPAADDEDEVAEYLAEWAEPWSLPELWGRWLLRLVAELGPRKCIELGTGFGISALYIGAGLELAGRGELLTLDREERLFPVAEAGFREVGVDRRVELHAGEISSSLATAARSGPFDWALIDAEHTEEATFGYFDSLLAALASGAIVVVDDISLSPGMRAAWRRIGVHPVVSLALDLRRLGVVVIR